jgi:acyl CoA:acetate/3-ketoacid CoA transferase
VGVFRLTHDGLEMIRRMPGVDLERDVMAHAEARLNIPKDIPVVDASVVTGEKFRLTWPDGA